MDLTITPQGLVWQEELINPGMGVPHGEIPGSMSSPSIDIPARQNPCSYLERFPRERTVRYFGQPVEDSIHDVLKSVKYF